MSINWSHHQCCKHCFKSQLLFQFPSKGSILFYTSGHRFCFFNIFRDKPSVVIEHSKELLDFDNVVQPPIGCHLLPTPNPYSMSFVWIDCSNLHWYYQPQELHCLCMKLALLSQNIQSTIHKVLHNLFNIFNVFLLRITIYQNVIQACWCKIIQCLPDMIFDISLEVGGSIHCSKLHHSTFEQGISGMQSYLVLIPFIHWKWIAWSLNSNVGKYSSILRDVECFSYQGDKVQMLTVLRLISQ